MNATTTAQALSACCNATISRLDHQGPWSCDNCHATLPTTIVAVQHDRVNLPVHQVTILADGMELVEYVGAMGYSVPAAIADLVEKARTYATVTGSVSGTYTEKASDGTTTRAQWFRTRYTRPRLVAGIHKGGLTLDKAQAVLKAEHGAQGEPVKGGRYVVAELSGYKVHQERPLEHRDCGCGNGVTTYAAGTVEAITHWMDNSVEATVRLESGRRVTVTMKPPSGDACF